MTPYLVSDLFTTSKDAGISFGTFSLVRCIT
jgi:hypothetical protein